MEEENKKEKKRKMKEMMKELELLMNVITFG